MTSGPIARTLSCSFLRVAKPDISLATPPRFTQRRWALPREDEALLFAEEMALSTRRYEDAVRRARLDHCTLLSTELEAARLRSRALIEVSVALRFASRLVRDRSAALRQTLGAENKDAVLVSNAAGR